MALTKTQREALKSMFGGRCAYCGCELGRKWHANHVEPVYRNFDGRLLNPQNERPVGDTAAEYEVRYGNN